MSFRNLLITITMLILLAGLAGAQATTRGLYINAKGDSLPAQTPNAQLADEALRQLLESQGKIEKVWQGKLFPLSTTPDEREAFTKARVKSETLLAANDIIFNFAHRVSGHYPSRQEVCAGIKLLDAAVKRHLDTQPWAKFSPTRKNFEVGEFLRREPAVELVYTGMGTCALLPWIEKK